MIKKIIAFILALIMSCGMLASCGEKDNKPTSIFGYTFLSVLSPSMEPLFNEGDIIVIKTIDVDSIKVGDVIAFFDPASTSDSVLTHRVIDIYEKDGKRYAVTAGDFNAKYYYERDLRIASAAEVDSEETKKEVLKKATFIEDPNKPGYEYVIYEPHKDSKDVKLDESNIIGLYTYTKIPLLGKITMRLGLGHSTFA